MFRCLPLLLAGLLALVPARAQFGDNSKSFEENLRDVAPAEEAEPARAEDVSGPDSDSSLRERFEAEYLTVLRKALGTSGAEMDPQFWARAHEIVFGERTHDARSAEAARAIFERGGDWPEVAYVPISPEAPAYTPGAEGERMEEALKRALEALEANPSPNREAFEEVIRLMAPFVRAIAAAEITEKGGLVVPAGTKLVYRTKPYCLQHNLGAPGGGDPMWLIPSRALIPPPALEIFEALLRHSEGHPGDRGVIQSLLWAIREADQRPLTQLTADQRRVLDAALPGGAERFLKLMQGGSSMRPGGGAHAGSGGDSTSASEDGGLRSLDARKREIARRNRQRAGIVEHGCDPHDPAQVNVILQRLEVSVRREVNVSVSQSVDAYTLLAVGVAARTTTDGLNSITIVIVNTSSTTFVFQPQHYVALTRAKRQPFAITVPAIPAPVSAAAVTVSRTWVVRCQRALSRR